ncbi:toprim domain-containing protein [Mesomycoplasma lagogenitalium]|uniref:Recombination protein RecR n=1 Tax=Mesomycoplasma lagogenitalium TaxID=171286 RepID=A0ABY8LVK8_9BACT|nr:toprim domain-containing protein [Mesomycoplasma lagogenitalium]WGI36318.1 toprim domain-containing protein [Mesomycoplasma lagogenitalium]
MFGPEFEKLIESLKKIPGITKKQSEKVAFYILNLDYQTLNELINSMKTVNQNLNKCITCNFITKNIQCDICLDVSRTKKLLLIESNNDVIKMENNKIFDGKYFIFDYKNREELNQNLENLLKRIQEFSEIIISFSPTMEGLTFTNYLAKILLEKTNKKISKISFGIPIGSSIDYMDEFSIKESIDNRKEIK